MKSVAITLAPIALASTVYFIPAHTMDSSNEPKGPWIIIRKKDRILEVFEGKKLVKTMKIVLGSEPIGNKEIEGDGKTPVGEFYVFTKNPESRFHLSLGLSYPSKSDAERGLRANLISNDEFESINKSFEEGGMPLQKTKLGGEIYIHGGGTDGDWTDGCIALNNEDITELFALIPKGARVTILP
jgi:murein L,D-transpeptidase YafK